MSFVSRQLVRFAHVDAAGIVFYPQYFVMLHGLIEDWFQDGLDIPYHDYINRRRIGLPTVRMEVDFVAVSRLGDAVRLWLQVARVGGASLTLEVGVTGADGVARMSMRQVLVCTSLETHRPLPLPDDLLAALADGWAG